MSSKSYSHSDRSSFNSADAAAADQSSPTEPKSPQNSELLDAVLRETTGNMTDEEAHELITGWIAKQSAGRGLDLEAVKALVEYLLSRQFRGSALAKNESASVAQVLWDDPDARARLQLLWIKAGKA
jgi:hypothetical protein